MPSQLRRCGAITNVTVSLLLAACAAAAPAPATPTPAVAVTASPTSPPTASPVPTASATPAPSPTQGAIVVVMNGGDTPSGPHLFFAPASITVPAGTISFSLNNQGDHVHGMSIATKLNGTALESTSVPPHTVKPFVVEGLAPGA